MKAFLTPNLSKAGRLVRGFMALVLLIGSWFGWQFSVWLGLLLLGSGTFVLFEALRGWCALRACGIKPKL